MSKVEVNNNVNQGEAHQYVNINDAASILPGFELLELPWGKRSQSETRSLNHKML